MDILAALEATQAPSTEPCVVQRWLDSIPDDQPGKDVLVATYAQPHKTGEHYRTLEDLTLLARTLGKAVSTRSVGKHRNGRCPCTGYSA